MKYLRVICPYHIKNEVERELEKCKSKCDELKVNGEST